MIQTGKEATRAVNNIKKRTGWTLRIIAKKADVSHNTIWRIHKGYVSNPQDDILKKIYDLELVAESL